jgi:hypothetical protein
MEERQNFGELSGVAADLRGYGDLGALRELTDEQELIPTNFIRVYSRQFAVQIHRFSGAWRGG